MALLDRKHYRDAVASFDHALAVRPGYRHLRGMRLHTLMHICAWDDFSAALAQVEAKMGEGEAASAPFAMLALSQSAPLQKLAAQRWAEEKFPRRVAYAPMPGSPATDKIRIGYFSADFREHPVSWLMAELFERHDRSRFEVYGFSFGPNDGSPMRSRLAAGFDHFVEVRHLSDSDIAQRSRELGIDIAIDLGGYTEGSRAGIFASRAAPVQVSYIGYLGTMGAPCIDYLLADETLVPPADRQHYTEKIAYLPWYQANDTQRRIADKTFTRAELGLPAQGVVFCCFNNNYKITPHTFDGWMRILKRVAGSVLLLYADNPEAATNLKAAARLRGVDDTRLIFGGFLPRADYLARYRAADLFLDTQPYNAGTTASDALWAGLPVLTRLGTTFAGRMAASVLQAAGLPQMITTSQQAYEDLAVALATDPHKLGIIRQQLAANRATMPLFDIATFTRHVEALYRQMHERRLAELAPDHLHA
jgi:predicted O-linked N-acetylglucosamine transferase (SPINDLY family)